MSAASATVPSAPIVTMAAMGGGGRVPPVPAQGGGSGGKCCESGRPVSTDPLTGQTICSCQYNPGALLMAAGCYPRGVGVGVPGLADAAGVYSSPYAAMQGLLPSTPGAEHAAFYSSMGALQGTAGYYAYDPFGGYPYGNGFAMDPNARRKNATRESTQTLKAWLSEHRKNPYPTKGEKIMLAIITKMTLTQVSTWFANARRRLKKENKMTWSPRNRCGDDDDLDNDDIDDDDDNKMNGDDNDTNNNRDFADDTSENNDVDILDCDDRSLLGHDSDYSKSRTLLGEDAIRHINVMDDDDSSAPSGNESSHERVGTGLGSAFTLVSPSSRLLGSDHSRSPSPHRHPHSRPHHIPSLPHTDSQRMRNGQHMLPKTTSPLTSPVTSQKPKIWSVADVMAKSSRDEDSERARSPEHSPPIATHPHHNGQHPPHPAFPSPPGAQNPSLSMARSMGLWNPSVTSLAAAGRFHPYGMGQGLFSMASHPGGAAAAAGIPTSRAHFPGHGLPTGMVPGLMGAPHPGGLGVPAGILANSIPTDLRKASPGSSALGRTSNGSPIGKSMTSPADLIRSREGSPLVPTAFKPVARSS